MDFKDEQLDEIEALLSQSMRGVHLLYDNNTIAQILQEPTEEVDFFSKSNLDRVQDLFASLINEPSLEKKHEFLKRLDHQSYEIILRTYFHILESTLLTASEFKH